MKRSPIKKISEKQKRRVEKLMQMKPPDDGLCEECGLKPDFRGLQRHHKVFRSLGGSDEKDNIIFVCGRCHSKLHGTKEC